MLKCKKKCIKSTQLRFRFSVMLQTCYCYCCIETVNCCSLHWQRHRVSGRCTDSAPRDIDLSVSPRATSHRDRRAPLQQPNTTYGQYQICAWSSHSASLHQNLIALPLPHSIHFSLPRLGGVPFPLSEWLSSVPVAYNIFGWQMDLQVC